MACLLHNLTSIVRLIASQRQTRMQEELVYMQLIDMGFNGATGWEYNTVTQKSVCLVFFLAMKAIMSTLDAHFPHVKQLDLLVFEAEFQLNSMYP